MSFADSQNGIAVGYSTLIRTTDGGNNWVNLPFSENVPPDLVAVWMLDSSRVIMIGRYLSRNYIFKSRDGGYEWQIGSTYYKNLNDISFADSLNGLIVGDEGVILRTTNAGMNWFEIQSGFTFFSNHVAYPDEAHAFIGCDSGKVLITSDGGQSWFSSDLQIENIFGLSFTSNLVGTVVGSDGLIFRTTDGGYNWVQKYHDPAMHPLSSVSFFNDNYGIVSGRDVIIRTKDGGENWTVLGRSCRYPIECTYMIDSTKGFASLFGQLFVLQDSCDADLELISPANGDLYVPLGQSLNDYHSIKLKWHYRSNLNFFNSILYVSTDSTFVTRDIYNVNVYNKSFPINNFIPGESYYWKFALQDCITNDTIWSPTWKFTTSRASLSGFVFDDVDKNGRYEEFTDKPMTDWPLWVTGKLNLEIHTDEYGRFSLTGLDTGLYVITDSYNQVWRRTLPDTNCYVVNLKLNDSISNLDFGRWFPWNTVHGIVFNDRNENGILDGNEKGFTGCAIQLSRDSIYDNVYPDIDGHYNINRIDNGYYYVSLVFFSSYHDSWEVIYPNNPPEYEIGFPGYNYHIENMNFAVHLKPQRIKIMLSVKDSTNMNQNIFWGIRSGATYGIWGVDNHSTNIDFSEGEGEIPPQFYGFFDARLINPDKTRKYFGEGSYVDMRDFTSTNQIDTFCVSFMPGYYWGGDYPMTLKWSRQDVVNSFRGDVVFIDKYGTRTDLKTNDSLVITNNSIKSLLLVTHSPILPYSSLKRWRMISIPTILEDNRPDVVFKPALPRAYSYKPNLGYITHDTLVPGVGYWVKGATFSDPTLLTYPMINCDTIPVETGWNLIGGISYPIPINNITTIPEGLVNGFYFGFDSLYFISDSIKPFNAYWVRSNGNGLLILSTNTQNEKSHSNFDPSELIAKANVLNFYDASGNICKLFYDLNLNYNGDASFFIMPPQPPEEVFDARFKSNQIIELIEAKGTKEIPIVLTNPSYPITIMWEIKSNKVTASLKIDNEKIPLKNKGSYILQNQTNEIYLQLQGKSDIPDEFCLLQNYPNPFNANTNIQYNLPSNSRVRISIYNLLGQEIETLVEEFQEAGYKTISWNGSDHSSGIYFYKIEAFSVGVHPKLYTQVKKMLLIK